MFQPDLRDLETCLRELAALGFTAPSSVKPGGRIAFGACGHVVPAREVEILAVRRLEGATDPSEEVIVLGLRCKDCDDKSAVALTYGPSVSSDDADVLQALDTTVWRHV